MRTKRLRVFAGPNGSGKSVLYEYLLSQNYFNKYYYVNADEISKVLFTGFSVQNWSIDVSKDDILIFLRNSTLVQKIDLDKVQNFLNIENNTFCWSGEEDYLNYAALLIADYLRDKLIESETSFSCETVLSHPSKIDFLRKAKNCGYKIYFYFIATRDPCINIARVQNRVRKGGHNVPDDVIEKRFLKTLDNLYPALLLSDKAYLFDNSESDTNRQYLNFAEYENGTLSFLTDSAPWWVGKYILEKSQGKIIN